MTIQQVVFNSIQLIDSIKTLDLSRFDCGNEALNHWLFERARSNSKRGSSRVYVLTTSTSELVGFYCLFNHSIVRANLKSALSRNMPDPIPTILLGRLAVDKRFQGMGIGRGLLRHAVERAKLVAQVSGFVGLVTEPIDEAATTFYLNAGFVPIKNGSALLIYPLH